MNNRILVSMVFQTDCISLRTVSRSRKSPHHFYILRSCLAGLGQGTEIIVHDINSFAILRLDAHAENVEIELTWLSGDGHSVSGYREDVILPYDKMAECLCRSTMKNNPVTWKVLSLNNSCKCPQLVFKSKWNLHAALDNGIIRRKLVRSLCREFRWPQAEKIEFYDNYMPYSFYFQEIQNGRPALFGGLVLHGQENMQKAYYGIHT